MVSTRLSIPGAAVLLVALSACATYSDTIRSTERSLAQQQPRLALVEYEKLDSSAAVDRALHLMNRGMLLRMAGDYEQSTRALEEAKNLIDKLRAVSVSEQALSLAVNDSAQSFIGADFEQVMVHAYLALNYLEQRKPDAARVEALQADVLLRQTPGALINPYAEDAFTRYLTGIVYEDEREWSDAMIAYRKAYEAYREQLDRFGVAPPETLKHDLIRLADRMGLAEEAQRYRETFGIRDTISAAALLEQGEIILTVHAGLAPAKLEHSVTVVNPNTGRLLRVALPRYHSRGHPLSYARVIVESQSATTSRVANIDAIAIKSLEARMPAITARAIARMILKDSMAKAASSGDRGSGGQALAGLAVNIAAVMAERADTRSWFTLPGEIHLARIAMPPGNYRGRIELYGSSGGMLQSSEFEIELGKGEKRYLSRHWIPTNIEVRP